ncbi:pyridoxal phosphate-dependent aminotransferase [Gymnodinialimonas sp.]
MTRAMPHFAQMSPYALAEMTAPDGKPLISLAQNECLRPPSPAAIDAAMQVLGDGALYPDPDWTALRQAIASQYGVDAAKILCGNGSLDLIGCIARVFTGAERAVLAPAHAYPFFRIAAQMANARFDTAPEVAATVSVDALLAAVRPDTGLVFLANPGNPTGTRIPRAEINRLRDGLRPDILLVVDEAYGEFADPLEGPCFEMVEGGNTVVLRTFSKAYGMAGFRVGWGVFPPEIAGDLRKALNPNNISAAAQAAATAAMADQAYMVETCALTARARDAAAAQLREAGIAVLESHTNFLLLDLGDVTTAKNADAALRAEGVFLRPQGGAGLPHCLRMTIGAPVAMDAALAQLIAWKKEQLA